MDDTLILTGVDGVTQLVDETASHASEGDIRGKGADVQRSEQFEFLRALTNIVVTNVGLTVFCHSATIAFEPSNQFVQRQRRVLCFMVNLSVVILCGPIRSNTCLI